jgi:transposase
MTDPVQATSAALRAIATRVQTRTAEITHADRRLPQLVGSASAAAVE